MTLLLSLIGDMGLILGESMELNSHKLRNKLLYKSTADQIKVCIRLRPELFPISKV